MGNLPKRKPIRIKDYDYSENGAYFITICTRDKEKIFWKPECDGSLKPYIPINGDFPETDYRDNLSEYGWVAYNAVVDIPKHYDCVSVDKFVIMPNHIHLIIIIDKYDFENGFGRIISAPAKQIQIIIGQFKRYVSKTIGKPIWQKSFYDHIIRGDDDFMNVWNYIDNNPAKWESDDYY